MTTGLRGLETVAYAATIAPAGRIVIAGQATDTHGHGQIVVARYLPNGRTPPWWLSHTISSADGELGSVLGLKKRS